MEGRWKGEGRVVGKVEYLEYLEVVKVKEGVYTYDQKTVHKEKGVAMHSERGFLRRTGNKVSLAVSHVFPVSEVEEGEVAEGRVTLESVSIARDPMGKEPAVRKVGRVFVSEGPEEMSYQLFLSTGEYSDRLHLECRLRRQ